MSSKYRFDKQTTIRMSVEMYEQIEEMCQKTGVTVMEWIRRACREKLQRGEFAENPVAGGLSYIEVEHVVKRALDNVLEERLKAIDKEIDAGIKSKDL